MTEPYDHTRWDRESESSESVDLEDARENVFDGWPSSEDVSAFAAKASASEPESPAAAARVPFSTALEPEEADPPPAAAEEPAGSAAIEERAEPEPEPAREPESELEPEPEPEPVALLDPAQVSQE